jgi:hypothetical protein
MQPLRMMQPIVCSTPQSRPISLTRLYLLTEARQGAPSLFDLQQAGYVLDWLDSKHYVRKGKVSVKMVPLL